MVESLTELLKFENVCSPSNANQEKVFNFLPGGRCSKAQVEKVVCLADGHILWPEPASDEEGPHLPSSPG